MAKVRLEEKSKFHKEFDNLKRELERNYEMKAKALMEREKNAIEGLQKHKEVNICKHLFFFHLSIFANSMETFLPTLKSCKKKR